MHVFLINVSQRQVFATLVSPLYELKHVRGFVLVHQKTLSHLFNALKGALKRPVFYALKVTYIMVGAKGSSRTAFCKGQ